MKDSFESLSQRVAYGYLATFPEFAAVESDSADAAQQEQMHNFMRGVAARLYEEPSVLGLPSLPDGCYKDWELQNSKPELIESMRRISKKLEDFYLLLLKLDELGETKDGKLFVAKKAMRLSPKTLDTLECLGLRKENRKDEFVLWSDLYPDMIPAWKLLSATAKESGANAPLAFSRCLFDPGHPRSHEVFLSLVDDKEAFRSLEAFFDGNGYRRVENRENGVSVDWVKNYGKKEEPLKANWAERTHGGLSVWYDYRREHPVLFGLRVPMYKELLARFDEMDTRLKDFVVSKTKRCDNCGFCTQTDKTGTRARQLVAVDHNGRLELCTLFPGFNYVWPAINGETAEGIIGFLAFTDKVLGR